MKRKIATILFFINILSLFAQKIDTKLIDLEQMKVQGLISEDDYKVLKEELTGELIEKKEIYNLHINSKFVSRDYSVVRKDGKLYFPMKKFLKYINFSNYKIGKKEVILHLGSTLREEKIELEQDGYTEKDEVYIEFVKFQEVFLTGYEIDEKRLKINLYLSFDTPQEIMQLVDISKNKLENKKEEEELIFTSKRKLFDLGYTRVQLGQSFDKIAGKKSYANDWDGGLGYQGGLLYGELTADYDFRDRELGAVRLEYTDIWKGHNLDFENRKYEKSREWGLEFYKDRNFYEDSGGQIIINERVPVGSRVELIYMGKPIEIQDELNGTVEFNNPLIRTDRTYILKIYEPDGNILEREIKTVKDYFLQKKGEIEYRVGINERKQYKRYETDASFYYGINNKLTTGFGYRREIEKISSNKDRRKIEYVNSITGDLVYGGTYNGLSYTMNLNTERTIDNTKFEMTREGEDRVFSFNDRSKYKYLNQFNYKKWKFIYEHEEYGKYYEESKQDKLDLEYDLFKHLNLGYEWQRLDYRVHTKEKEKKRVFTADTDYSWGKLLFSMGISKDIEHDSNNEYRISSYYSGWRTLTGKLENVWTKDGKEYESKLIIYNNNYKGFLDFSTELSYSNKEKERMTVSVAMKFDDWLTLDNTFGDKGKRNHRIGIDKIIDLKNPIKKLDGMDNSRIKVTTFIDKNNNNILDKDEERVDGIEVKLGNEVVSTNKNGEGFFFGVGNGNIYDIDVKIKKPSFTIGNNIIKVKSNFSSTVDVYIPIKPMLTLSGTVEIDKALGLSEADRESFYSDLVVELKDLNGKVIEASIPDNEGRFDISGLFPKDYYIEVTYIGTKFDLKTIREEIELLYAKENSVNQVKLTIGNNNMAIKMEEQKLARLGG